MEYFQKIIGGLFLVGLLGSLIYLLNKKKYTCDTCKYQTYSERYGKPMMCCKIYGCPAQITGECKMYEQVPLPLEHLHNKTF